MYIPSEFRNQDPDAALSIIDRFGFATIVTGGPPLVATHVPVLVERDPQHGHRLLWHLARRNEQCKSLGTSEALVIFQGPHAYVSPTWYASSGVPTWNYVAIHAYGTPERIDDDASVRRLIDTMTRKYESARTPSWSADAVAHADLERMLRDIMAYKMTISRLEAKFKLSQNRSPADAKSVSDRLAESEDPLARETAALMQKVRR